MMKSFFCLIAMTLLASCSPLWEEKKQDGYSLVRNKDGETLGYSPESGVKILTVDRLAFKDLNKNDSLDAYEDWRLPAKERAKDLASKLTIEQIAGLMLYSGHQAVPARSSGYFGGTYGGKPLEESGVEPFELTDQQKAFLEEDNLRHVLITSVQSPEIAARWNNRMQAFVEGLGAGIPANNSSDPRHGANTSAEYNAGNGGAISMWPESLGLAATFDAELVENFGKIASREYRALGITTALSPQIDLGTEPRWNRISGTFGEDPRLSADLARAYVDGFQTSGGEAEIAEGWGFHSVNAMVKHWPGGGPEEGGRDGHFAYGKFAVYPGNSFDTHLVPFLEGAFKLEGKTKSASAVMPYYTISYDQDKKYGENVGNSFSKYIINDLLREKYGYDGVVCTDWRITGNEGDAPDVFMGKPWGVEDKSVAERHYKVIMAGVDQFGGNNEAGPVLEAYRLGVAEHGEKFMRDRFEQSAVRLLVNIMRTGLFENPYLDPAETKQIVGKPEFMTAGFEAQLKSIVMLKNRNGVLPLKRDMAVYIPKRKFPSQRDWFGNLSEERVEYPLNMELIKKYFRITDDPADAEVALVQIKSPDGGVGYDRLDRSAGRNGYVPITLQYGPYKAVAAREKSIAAGDPVIAPDVTNRSYRNKGVTAGNVSDLTLVKDTKQRMNGKPVIVVVQASGPMVFREIEPEADAILMTFGVQDQAVIELLNGREPAGLLPLQMPADMNTVEKQMEDVPHDMTVHIDSEGHAYNFGFGMNWAGVIDDERTKRYKGPGRELSGPVR